MQSHPAIGDPNPNENPITPNASPTLSADIPKSVSLTERIGSKNIQQTIDKAHIIIAIIALLLERI